MFIFATVRESSKSRKSSDEIWIHRKQTQRITDAPTAHRGDYPTGDYGVSEEGGGEKDIVALTI